MNDLLVMFRPRGVSAGFECPDGATCAYVALRVERLHVPELITIRDLMLAGY